MLAHLKIYEVKLKGFQGAKDKNIPNKLQNLIYLIMFGHKNAQLFEKKWCETAQIPALQKLTHR